MLFRSRRRDRPGLRDPRRPPARPHRPPVELPRRHRRTQSQGRREGVAFEGARGQGDTWTRGISEQGRAAPLLLSDEVLTDGGKRLADGHNASGRGATASRPCLKTETINSKGNRRPDDWLGKHIRSQRLQCSCVYPRCICSHGARKMVLDFLDCQDDVTHVLFPTKKYSQIIFLNLQYSYIPFHPHLLKCDELGKMMTTMQHNSPK